MNDLRSVRTTAERLWHSLLLLSDYARCLHEPAWPPFLLLRVGVPQVIQPVVLLMEPTAFYLQVTGQVESCQMQGVNNLYCRYNFKSGTDWEYLHGLQYGMTQIASGVPRSEGVFLWNYPLEASFRSRNPYGWPALVLSVYGLNALGRDVVRGYGFVHVPAEPGRHLRYVELYRPRSSSLCNQIMAWLLGSPPEFFDSNLVAQGRGRQVTRVTSSGKVKVVFNVISKNMRALGYSINDANTEIMQQELQEKAAPA